MKTPDTRKQGRTIPARAQILVYGAGAIGMTFGGFLSRHHDVTLLGRTLQMNAVRRRGVRISGIWGRHIFKDMKTAPDLRGLLKNGGGYDLILVCVKAYDSVRAARELRGLARRSGAPVLLLQNGLGNIEAFRRFIPAEQLLAGRVIFGAELFSPARIKITVIAQPTAVGEASAAGVTPRVRRIVRMFNRAGLPSAEASDIQTELWAKVAFNCALNPLASILDCHYGYLGEHELTRELMNEIIEEIYGVARAMKVKVRPADSRSYEKLFYAKLLPSTYGHHPSMLQDLRKGKKTEIDALNGAIARYAKSFGLDAPVNALLAREIRRLEKK